MSFGSMVMTKNNMDKQVETKILKNHDKENLKLLKKIQDKGTKRKK